MSINKLWQNPIDVAYLITIIRNLGALTDDGFLNQKFISIRLLEKNYLIAKVRHKNIKLKNSEAKLNSIFIELRTFNLFPIE